jgi:hypothetical protein
MSRELPRALLAVALWVVAIGATPMSEPKDECEDLLNTVLPLAEKHLTEHGEFFPFGATLSADGKQAVTMAYDGTDRPPSQPLIELLRDGYRQGARSGKLTATALVYDVLVIPPGTSTKTDAIAVELDHSKGYSLVVFFPYMIKSGQVAIGTAFANAGENAIFGEQIAH